MGRQREGWAGQRGWGGKTHRPTRRRGLGKWGSVLAKRPGRREPVTDNKAEKQELAQRVSRACGVLRGPVVSCRGLRGPALFTI